MTKKTERKQVPMLAALAGLSFMGYMLGSIFVGAMYSPLLGTLMLRPILWLLFIWLIVSGPSQTKVQQDTGFVFCFFWV